MIRQMKVRKPTDRIKVGIGNKDLYSFLFALLFSSVNIFAQKAFDNKRIPYDMFEREWTEFCFRSRFDMGMLRRYFNDTVSVVEMTERFHAYYDKRIQTSPYIGLDSVIYSIRGENVLLTSPFQRSSIKDIHGKRGVWKWGTRFFLHQIMDDRGILQEKLVNKINNSRDSLAWMEGDFVTLRSPRHYMGLIVSPRPYLQTYDGSRLIGRCGNLECQADFFSFAGPTYVMDGEWYHKIRGGAEYMSRSLTLYSGFPDKNVEERTFSVLLYMKPESSWMNREYTLKLLLPTNADEETKRAFERMRRFVENIKFNAFNPLYTTDFRIMTGRYYRVTVNKCGWLVEDYFDINN